MQPVLTNKNTYHMNKAANIVADVAAIQMDINAIERGATPEELRDIIIRMKRCAKNAINDAKEIQKAANAAREALDIIHK